MAIAAEIIGKEVEDSRIYTMDWSQLPEIKDAQTISTVSVTASPAGLTIGSTDIATPLTTARISGGIQNITYSVLWTITTSGGSTIECNGQLAVY